MVLPRSSTTGLSTPDFSGNFSGFNQETVTPGRLGQEVSQPQPAPSVPQVPKVATSGDGVSTGNGSGSSTTKQTKAPSPQKVTNDEVISKLLRPALTTHFQCVFNPPDVPEIRQYYLDSNRGDTITLLCSDAALPGSSLLTNEINDDYTGVTERLGYRRSYDDRAEFTFFVDHGTQNGGYNVIRLFEAWIRYAMGETSDTTGPNYNYRVRFPDGPNDQTGGAGYRTEMFIQKFERDFLGNYLEYVFVRAYPISINSMPVSYESASLLKCTVSFAFNRYILRSFGHSLEQEPQGQPPAPGVPSPTSPVSPTTTSTGDIIPLPSDVA